MLVQWHLFSFFFGILCTSPTYFSQSCYIPWTALTYATKLKVEQQCWKKRRSSCCKQRLTLIHEEPNCLDDFYQSRLWFMEWSTSTQRSLKQPANLSSIHFGCSPDPFLIFLVLLLSFLFQFSQTKPIPPLTVFHIKSVCKYICTQIFLFFLFCCFLSLFFFWIVYSNCSFATSHPVSLDLLCRIWKDGPSQTILSYHIKSIQSEQQQAVESNSSSHTVPAIDQNVLTVIMSSIPGK